jgi:glycosyltransferase involved in cell wall biosynthesis
MSRVKVLRIINRLNIGGPSLNAAFLSKYIPENEYESVLLYGQNDIGEESALYLFDELGLKPILVENMHRRISFFNDFKAFLFIYKYIKRYKPDIVHTHASKAGLLGRLAAKLAGVSVIIHTFHGNVFEGYFGKVMTFIILTIERTLAKFSTKIISISESQKKDLVEKYKIVSGDKVAMVKLGFDLTKFKTNIDVKRNDFRGFWNIPADELVITIIGRLAPIKNHTLFIDAVVNLKKKNTIKFTALVVGDGELRELLFSKCIENDLVIQYGEKQDEQKVSDIIFTSWVKDIDKVIAASDIVCLTSINEGTPVCLIESISGSTPVVSTRVGGIEDIMGPNEGALLSDLTIENFDISLRTVINNLEHYTKCANEASSTVIEKFSYRRLVSDIDTIYKECMDAQTA